MAVRSADRLLDPDISAALPDDLQAAVLLSDEYHDDPTPDGGHSALTARLLEAFWSFPQ